MPELTEIEHFLASLVLKPQLAAIKTLEVDLKGYLNPTIWLDRAFFTENRLLDFAQFLEYYLHHTEKALRKRFAEREWDEVLQGLEARLYRTQFGMLTEYHAYFLCRVFFGSQNVRRSADLDKKGVDFQILFQQQTYNIHIFVDTQRAWAYRQYKSQHKEGNSVEGIHVNLPYSLLRQQRFNALHFLPNGFGIYSNSYLAYFRSEMQAGRIRNNNIIGTNPDGFIYDNTPQS
jgi:hypothetical protein